MTNAALALSRSRRFVHGVVWELDVALLECGIDLICARGMRIQLLLFLVGDITFPGSVLCEISIGEEPTHLAVAGCPVSGLLWIKRVISLRGLLLPMVYLRIKCSVVNYFVILLLYPSGRWLVLKHFRVDLLQMLLDHLAVVKLGVHGIRTHSTFDVLLFVYGKLVQGSA